jgi:hypothetical protein
VLSALNAAPGAAALGVEESARLKRVVSGTNPELSVPVRRELAVLLSAEQFVGAPPERQTEQLKAFIKEEVGVPDLVSVDEETRMTRQAFSVSAPVSEPNFAFEKHPADGQRFEVQVGEKKVTVHSASSIDAGWLQHPVEQVANALAALPASSLALVKEVRLEPGTSPADDYFARVYNRPGFHSYMTAGADGIIRIYPNSAPPTQEAIDGTIIHETGHILSHRLLGDDAAGPKWDSWRAAAAKDGLHPSQYARINPDEDLSESLELYTLVKGGPSDAGVRALLPARFEQLDKMLSQKVGP